MKSLQITGGAVIIDDNDLALVGAHRWRNSMGYAVTNIYPGGKMRRLRMHRLLLGVGIGRYPLVDHINGDPLDNRRCNLRLATETENHWNRRKIRGVSKFKGVRWKKSTTGIGGSWEAQFRAYGKNYTKGGFKDEILAAKQYDAFAREYAGEFAATNFPIESAMPKEGV